ncbi:cytosine permease [Rhodoglobus aureus]|uniref:Purine-cytosine permease n=1 Tax=Rhodoglobus aureus TaxID=191497 RepID=A0ABP4G7B8_9MICO
MAFHDDVDDANDANDKTSSEHEFKLPFPRRAASNSPAANSANDSDESDLVDLSEASNDGVYDLDADLGVPASSQAAAPRDLPPPPRGASSFEPIDLNDEFQRSDLSEGLDQGKRPWSMAPAPDPTQAVPELDAPDGLSDEQHSAVFEIDGADDETETDAAGSYGDAGASDGVAPPVDDFASKPAVAANDDPYQIPVDYTTPDFFASRISPRRILPDQIDREEQLAQVDESTEHVDDRPQPVDDFAESAEVEDESDFNFDSLFATQDLAVSADESALAGDTSWPEVSSAVDTPQAAPAEESPTTNNIWKLGPLEPNAATEDTSSPAEPTTTADDALDSVSEMTSAGETGDDDESAFSELPLAVEDVIEGAPIWNLDDVVAPEVSNDAGLGDAALGDAALGDALSAEAEVVPDSPELVDLAADTDADAPVVADVSESAEPLVAEPGESPVEELAEPSFVQPTESAFSQPAVPGGDERAPSDEWARVEAAAIETEAPAETPGSVVTPDEVEHTATPESVDEAEIAIPPVRRSMADDELLNWADKPENQSTGTLSVIEVLEAQLRLREEDAREFREWETTIRSKVAPVADEVVEQVPPERVPLESSAAAPTPPAAQLPSWNVPPPSDTWAPGDDFDDEIPFAAHADPTGSITLPALHEETLNEVQVEDESVSDAIPAELPSGEGETGDAETDRAPEFVDSAPAAPEPEPESESESESEQIVPNFDVEVGPVSLGGVQPPPESVTPSADDASSAPTANQFEHSPELPADEDGDYHEIPFTPPPLVEPITAPSTPRSNLDEHVSFGDFGFTPPVSGETESGEPEAGAEPTTDATAAAPASDADNEPAFAFDLDSPSGSAAATKPDLQATETDALDDDIDAQAPVVEDSTAAPEADSEAAPAPFSFASQETPRYVPTAPLNFDDLLNTVDLDDSDEESESDEANPLDAFLSAPDTELFPQADPLAAVETDSIPISGASPEAELDDAVDESDRLTYPADLAAPHAEDDSNPIPFAAAPAGTSDVWAVSSAATPAPGIAAAATSGTPPLATDASAVPQPMPLSAARVSQQPLGLDDVAPTAQRVFSLEESGLEPTPVDRRIGHAARLFWLWFAANSSIVSIGLGAAVFAVGMSLRQSVVAILAGVALSFIPLGLTTLAGKRSGQPTMVISRSAFGLVGNIVPSLVALVGRLFWGAVLLWVLASSVAIVLIGSDLNVGLGDRQLLLIALALSFLVALVIAFAGYPLFARIQLILSIISGILVIGLIAFTAQYVDVSEALTTPDGSWLLTLTGAVLVFSFLGLVWAYSGADIARYQRVSSSGPASALSASFGAALPAFVLIAYGALLAASDPALARGFLASPLDTLLPLLPGWYPIPLLLAAALSLLSGITLSLYSGGFALQAIGVRLPRQWSIVIVGVLLGALSVLFAFGVNGGINELFRDVATTLAVPTAAWVGIFAAETMIRTRRLDSAALTKRGGIYADVRWVNLSAFILISAIGFALTSATIGWLSWQGYGFAALGIDLSSELAASDLGVLVALVLGMLTPIVAGIPAIKRQEAGSSDRAVRPA